MNEFRSEVLHSGDSCNMVPSNGQHWCFGQAGGFDMLLLDSLYEDDNARRQIQLQNAGYGYGGLAAVQNPFEQQHQQQQQKKNDPFIGSNSIAPPPNVQMALMQQLQQQQMLQQNQQLSMMLPYQQLTQFPQQQTPQTCHGNPFEDSFGMHPNNSTPQQGNHMLL